MKSLITVFSILGSAVLNLVNLFNGTIPSKEFSWEAEIVEVGNSMEKPESEFSEVDPFTSSTVI